MKKFYSLFCCLALSLGLANTSYAQYQDLSYFNDKSDNSNASSAIRLNAIKINLTSLTMRNISLQYERLLTSRISGAIGYRWMPNGKIPQLGLVKDLLEQYGNLGDQQGEIFNILDAARLKGFAWTPELRVYLNKKYKGFYFGFFGRYEQLGLNAQYPFTIDGEDYVGKLKAKFSNIGAGINLGIKFNITERIILDWWILGPYIGGAGIDMHLSDYKIDQEDLKEFEEQLEGITLTNKYFKATINPGTTSSTAKITGSLPGVRAMGINLGFRF